MTARASLSVEVIAGRRGRAAESRPEEARVAKQPARIHRWVARHVERLRVALRRAEWFAGALRRAARFAGVRQHEARPGAGWRYAARLAVVPSAGEVPLPVAARSVSLRVPRDVEPGQPGGERARRAAGEPQGFVVAALAPLHGWRAQARRRSGSM